MHGQQNMKFSRVLLDFTRASLIHFQNHNLATYNICPRICRDLCPFVTQTLIFQFKMSTLNFKNEISHLQKPNTDFAKSHSSSQLLPNICGGLAIKLAKYNENIKTKAVFTFVRMKLGITRVKYQTQGHFYFVTLNFQVMDEQKTCRYNRSCEHTEHGVDNKW